MKPLAIDLFCGLGGWTEGLLDAGYYVVGFDIEQHIYGDDRYPAQLVVQDVMTLHGSQFRDAALIVASPPCQEFSYMAMPWGRAKQIGRALRGADDFPEGYRGSRTPEELTALFDACFRLQREASEAAGRHVPMVVENVKGAQPWVGRASGPDAKVSEAFVFEGGSLTVHTNGKGDANGTGWFCFREEDLEWERGDDDRIDYRIANLDRSEILALRDQLNKLWPAVPSPTNPEPEAGESGPPFDVNGPYAQEFTKRMAAESALEAALVRLAELEAAPSPTWPQKAEIEKAGRNAPLPKGYQWGYDALQAFNFGKLRATQAILAHLQDGGGA